MTAPRQHTLDSNAMKNYSSFFRSFAASLALVVAAGVGVTAFSSDAWAQRKKNPHRAVEKKDTDGDGKVSLEEWDKSPNIFKKIDKDGDGFLSAEDFAKHWGITSKGGRKAAETEDGGDPVQQARNLLAKSDAASDHNRSQESLIHIRKAAEIIINTNAPDKLIQKIFYKLGKREFRAGNVKAAIKAAKEAVDAKPLPSNLSELVRYYLSVGRVRKAEKLAEEARSTAEGYYDRRRLPEEKRMKMARDIALMDSSLLQKQGLWREAEPKIREALEWGEKLVSWDSKWLLHFLKLKWSLASNLLKQGRSVEAEIVAREGFNEARSKAKGAYGHAAVLARYVGEGLLAQGRLTEAQAMAAEAIRLIALSGESTSSRKSVLAKRFMGMVMALQGNWKDADIQFLQAGRDLAEKQDSKRSILDNNPFVILTAIKMGRAKDVRAQLEKKYAGLQKRLGDKSANTAQARSLLGMARAQMGEKEAAFEDLTQASSVLISGSPSAEADEDDSKSYETILQREVLETYMALLADFHAAGKSSVGGIDPIAETFRIADKARGSIVQKALAASGARAVAGNEELSKLVRTEQDGRKSIAALNDFLANILSKPESQREPEAVEELRDQIESTREARADAIEEIEDRFPEYAKLINPQPATLEQAAAVLNPDEALITTYFGAEHGYAWAVNAKGDKAFTRIGMGAEDIDDMISILRSALDPGVTGIADIPEFEVTTAHELYAGILGPLESVWKPTKNLILVAHGPLGALPISLLPTTAEPLAKKETLPFGGYRSVKWLARTHSVTLVPSVGAMTALRRLPPAAEGRAPFVGFGDPYFNKQQQQKAAEQQVAQADTGVALRGVPITLRSALRGKGVGAGELAKLPRLSDTASEVLSIAGALNAAPEKSVYLGEKATEEQVKSMDLSRYRVITFATHGLVPGELSGLVQPALAMSSPEITGNKDSDGLLTMEEILNLKLDADWVILSACNTAAGEGAGAEALFGLGQAFFYAGTRSLLASNWPVETTSAKALTTDIFRRQTLEPNLSRSEALRRSMMNLMEQGVSRDKNGKAQFAFAHPMFWAPFSLIGDGR